MDQTAISLKILLIGDSGVGKSSLMIRFVQDAFHDNISTTIGIDYKVKSIVLEDGSTLTLNIWDTAGQDRFRTLTSSYYRGANGVILVYDCNDMRSFEALQTHWLPEARAFLPQSAVFLLVGNKVDLTQSAETRSANPVPRETAEQFARENRMLFCLCSAKTKEGVAHAFEELGRTAAQHAEKIGSSSAKRQRIKLDQQGSREDDPPSCC